MVKWGCEKFTWVGTEQSGGVGEGRFTVLEGEGEGRFTVLEGEGK